MEQITKQRILEELGAIAFARVTDLVAVEDGQLIVGDTRAMEELAPAVASVEKASGGLKVKFYDKLKALELLGKAVGLFEDGVQTQEDNGLLAAILAATAEPGEGMINEEIATSLRSSQ